MLADKLNKSSDNAERWIVNLIREARLDAKIDAKEVVHTLACIGASCNVPSTTVSMSMMSESY